MEASSVMTITHPPPLVTTSPKHTQIMDAAHKLFLELGYGATSMDAIAEEANVSKRTVYSHFGSKEALFSAVMGYLCNSMGFNDQHAPESASVRDYLFATGRGFLAAVLQPTALATLRVIIAEAGKFPELGELFWGQTSQVHRCRLADYLDEQHRRGILDIPDGEVAAMQFLGLVKGPFFLAALTGVLPNVTEAQRDFAVENAVDVFLHGVSR